MIMELNKARNYAEKIVAALSPMAKRIEIAGSIRRNKPMVGDIDLVIEPKPGQLHAIKQRCLTGTLTSGNMVMMDGEMNFIMMLGTVQLDIFFARPAVPDLFNPKPANFGSLLLCRTGSKEHNIWLIGEAKARGLAWLPYEGVVKDGRVVAGETEEDIFRALRLEYVKPENRERKH